MKYSRLKCVEPMHIIGCGFRHGRSNLLRTIPILILGAILLGMLWNQRFWKDNLQETRPDKLKQDVRILCLILTSNRYLFTRARTVASTWAKRCNRHFFVLHTNLNSSEIINTPFDDRRSNTVLKVQYAIRDINYKHQLRDFDWLLVVDDKAYVILENIRHLFKYFDSQTPSYVTFPITMPFSDYKNDDNTIYAINSKGLLHLVNIGLSRGLCVKAPWHGYTGKQPYAEMSRCLEESGVSAIQSATSGAVAIVSNHSMRKYLREFSGSYLHGWATYSIEKGSDCCGSVTISFHFMEPDTMVLVDHLLYRTSVFGVHSTGTSDKLPSHGA